MYHVTLSDYELKGSVVLAEVSAVEPALGLALEIHRVSNVPHIVQVFNVDDSETIVSLTLDPGTHGKLEVK